MQNNHIDISGIQGIQELEDSSAQSCVGGSFEITRFRDGASDLVTGVYASRSRFRLRSKVGITGIEIRNLTPGQDDSSFDLIYRNTRGREIARETIFSGQEARLYAGNGQLNDGRRTARVDVIQNFTVSPDDIGFRFSDRRIKTEINEIGNVSELKIKLYSWRYRNDDSTRFVGVMAQDLLEHPDFASAVTVAQSGEFKGFYAVDYSILGLRMTTEEEWNINGIDAVRQPVAFAV